MKMFIEQDELSPEPLPEPASANDRLVAAIEHCYQMRSQWDLKLIELVAEVERRQLYFQDGHLSTADWLTARLNIGHTRAVEFVNVAICLAELPKTKAAYQAGELSYDHLRALVKVANEDTEADLLEACEGISVGDTWKLIEAVLAVSKDESLIARSERFLEFKNDHESRSVLMFGKLPEEQGVIVKKLVNSLAKKLPKDPGPLDPEEQPLPIEKRRADALVAMVSGSAEVPNRPLLVVHAPSEVMATGIGVAEIEGGPMIGADTALKLACDCDYYIVTEDKYGNPIGVGRKTRSVPEKLAREIRKRDKHCRFPGCNRVIGVNHHIKHWGGGQNGETEPGNLVLLCSLHHDYVHEGGYIVQGEPPNVWIERPKREPIKFGPPKRTPEARAEFESEMKEFDERAGPPPDV